MFSSDNRMIVLYDPATENPIAYAIFAFSTAFPGYLVWFVDISASLCSTILILISFPATSYKSFPHTDRKDLVSDFSSLSIDWEKSTRWKRYCCERFLNVSRFFLEGPPALR